MGLDSQAANTAPALNDGASYLFAKVMTTGKKKILARVIGIQK